MWLIYSFVDWCDLVGIVVFVFECDVMFVVEVVVYVVLGWVVVVIEVCVVMFDCVVDVM